MAETQIKGENVGDRSLSHLDIDLSNAPAKATVVAGDRFAMVDSGDSLLKTASLNVVETYFNSKYSLVGHNHDHSYDNYGSWLLTVERTTANIAGVNQIVGYQGLCILPGTGISFDTVSNLDMQMQVTINSSASGMVYPGPGIAVSTGYSWGASIVDSSAKWNQAFSERNNWNGGSTGLVAATGRTSLGLVIGTHVLAQRTFGTAANNASTDFFYKYPTGNSDSWNDGDNYATAWSGGRPESLPVTVHDFGISVKFQRNESIIQFHGTDRTLQQINGVYGSGELWYRTGYGTNKRFWHNIYHNHSPLADYVAGSTGVVTVGDTLTTALSKLQTETLSKVERVYSLSTNVIVTGPGTTTVGLYTLPALSLWKAGQYVEIHYIATWNAGVNVNLFQPYFSNENYLAVTPPATSAGSIEITTKVIRIGTKSIRIEQNMRHTAYLGGAPIMVDVSDHVFIIDVFNSAINIYIEVTPSSSNAVTIKAASVVLYS